MTSYEKRRIEKVTISESRLWNETTERNLSFDLGAAALQIRWDWVGLDGAGWGWMDGAGWAGWDWMGLDWTGLGGENGHLIYLLLSSLFVFCCSSLFGGWYIPVSLFPPLGIDLDSLTPFYIYFS